MGFEHLLKIGSNSSHTLIMWILLPLSSLATEISNIELLKNVYITVTVTRNY
jgi:hypothetical protein